MLSVTNTSPSINWSASAGECNILATPLAIPDPTALPEQSTFTFCFETEFFSSTDLFLNAQFLVVPAEWRVLHSSIFRPFDIHCITIMLLNHHTPLCKLSNFRITQHPSVSHFRISIRIYDCILSYLLPSINHRLCFWSKLLLMMAFFLPLMSVWKQCIHPD